MEKVKSRLQALLKHDLLLFAIIILILSFIYGFHKSSFVPPQGLHQWRQCVGAAFAKNYANYDLDITASRVYNYISSNATSDQTFAECPILYYFVAILYKIFGTNDTIFRIINLLILFIGLFYLFRTSRLIISDRFWSMVITIVVFTSPTLVYYANSFLPDTSAFGLVFIALYFVVRYSENPKTRYLYLIALFYALAGLLKITALLSLMALIGTFLLCQLLYADVRSRFKLKPGILPMIIPFIAVGVWYYVVYFYNSHYGGIISKVDVRPIWILDDATISMTWERISHEWIHNYFNVYLELLAGLLFLGSLALFRKSNRFLTILTTLTIIGGTGFFFLFFRSLYQHDYYLINLFIIIPMILMNGALMLKKYFPALFRNFFVKIMVTVIVAFLVYKVVGKVDYYRYSWNYNHLQYKYFKGLVDIEPLNRELGIKPHDLIISIPDPSINISLYLMNQPGFTEYGFTDLHGADRIDFFISKGADYLIVADTGLYADSSYSYILPYTDQKIARHRNVDIFDLRGYQ